MAASPVRKLLNPQNFQSDFESSQAEPTEPLQNKKTPLSTKDVMVLNERSMLVAKILDSNSELADERLEDLFIVTPVSSRNSDVTKPPKPNR